MSPSNATILAIPEFSSKLLQLRDQSLKPAAVRSLTGELAEILAKHAIVPPAENERVALMVILRSGLAMSEAFARQFSEDTDVVIYHLGLFRDRQSLQPVEYYNKLPPKDPLVRHAYILDPVVATGGTASAAINIVKDWGIEKITMVSILGSQAGLGAISMVWPEGTNILIGAVDTELDSKGYVRPGLGDIGDRLFGTTSK